MNIKTYALVLFASFFLMSCSSSKIFVENDIVKGTQKTKLTLSYSYNQLKRNQAIYWQNLIFTQEKDKNGLNTYMIYDIITRPSAAYDLDPKAYLVIDKDVFELENMKVENNYYVIKNEIKEEIMTADSTKTEVVTGYNENQNKTIRMLHPINSEIVNRLQQADEISFRYYAGPHMITTNIRHRDLIKIRKVFQP